MVGMTRWSIDDEDSFAWKKDRHITESPIVANCNEGISRFHVLCPRMALTGFLILLLGTIVVHLTMATIVMDQSI